MRSRRCLVFRALTSLTFASVALASVALASVALARVALARVAMAQPRVGTSPISPAPEHRVQSGIVVRPDTVRIGDPFELIVTVVVPPSARVEWPSLDDTTAAVVMRAPVRINSIDRAQDRRETATYALAAWGIGDLPVGLPDAIIRFGETVMHVPLVAAHVYVRTVLPGDTSLHKPKPAKPLFPRQVPWWERWWPAAVVIAALALLWWLYRRRKTAVARRRAVPVDVYARAMNDFNRLDRLALPKAGEGGRFVALAVEILRSYLAARVPDATLSRTSAELLQITETDARVPASMLATLLAESDAVKFARRDITAVRAHELASEARAIVEAIEQAELARRAAVEAERVARERADDRAAQATDDDARRRSRRPKAGAR